MWLLLVYIHVLACVFLVGYALFWAVLSFATQELREHTARAVWPPEGLPSPIRLRMFGVGWLAYFLALATGALALGARGFEDAGGLGPKLFMIAVAGVFHVQASVAPRALALRLHLLFLLLAVVVSVMLPR